MALTCPTSVQLPQGAGSSTQPLRPGNRARIDSSGALPIFGPVIEVDDVSVDLTAGAVTRAAEDVQLEPDGRRLTFLLPSNLVAAGGPTTAFAVAARITPLVGTLLTCQLPTTLYVQAPLPTASLPQLDPASVDEEYESEQVFTLRGINLSATGNYGVVVLSDDEDNPEPLDPVDAASLPTTIGRVGNEITARMVTVYALQADRRQSNPDELYRQVRIALRDIDLSLPFNPAIGNAVQTLIRLPEPYVPGWRLNSAGTATSPAVILLGGATTTSDRAFDAEWLGRQRLDNETRGRVVWYHPSYGIQQRLTSVVEPLLRTAYASRREALTPTEHDTLANIRGDGRSLAIREWREERILAEVPLDGSIPGQLSQGQLLGQVVVWRDAIPSLQALGVSLQLPTLPTDGAALATLVRQAFSVSAPAGPNVSAGAPVRLTLTRHNVVNLLTDALDRGLATAELLVTFHRRVADGSWPATDSATVALDGSMLQGGVANLGNVLTLLSVRDPLNRRTAPLDFLLQPLVRAAGSTTDASRALGWRWSLRIATPGSAPVNVLGFDTPLDLVALPLDLPSVALAFTGRDYVKGAEWFSNSYGCAFIRLIPALTGRVDRRNAAADGSNPALTTARSTVETTLNQLFGVLDVLTVFAGSGPFPPSTHIGVMRTALTNFTSAPINEVAVDANGTDPDLGGGGGHDPWWWKNLSSVIMLGAPSGPTLTFFRGNSFTDAALPLRPGSTPRAGEPPRVIGAFPTLHESIFVPTGPTEPQPLSPAQTRTDFGNELCSYTWAP